MSDFSVSGANDFYKLSKALKAAGKGELRKDLNKELKAAVKPLIPKTRAAARATLPKRGGLADQVAREPQRVQVRTGEKTAGVRLVVGKKKGAARSSNRGTVRHPAFGDRSKFYEQKVPSGWFDDVVEKAKPDMQRATIDAMESIADKIVRGL